MNTHESGERKTVFSGEKETSRAFVEFRSKSAEELNVALQAAYESGDTDVMYGLLEAGDPEMQKIVDFVAEAFQGKTRKDGKHLAVHSLQLSKNARYWGIEDRDVHTTVLLHDIAEDTAYRNEDIRERFGDRAADFADIMTERRESGDRDLALIAFIGQLQRGGLVTITSEIIDRMDDLSDVRYLSDVLADTDASDVEKEKARSRLAEKLAKCKFTVDSLLETMQENPGIATKFYELYEYQKQVLGVPVELINHKLEEFKNKRELVNADKTNKNS